jgi:hypothetical protein
MFTMILIIMGVVIFFAGFGLGRFFPVYPIEAKNILNSILSLPRKGQISLMKYLIEETGYRGVK